jgi:hypothetical protein
MGTLESFSVMRPKVLRTRLTHHAWCALQCLYAGLFAFVLPLICWGAQATPGHPHARAHFLFATPPLQAQLALVTNNANTSNAGGPDHSAHHAAQPATEQPAAEQPVGRAVPSILGFSLLLLIGLAGTLLPRRGDEPAFSRWIPLPVTLSVAPSIPTPPPR